MSHLTKELIAIRPGQPEDLNFIYATWLQGLYYGNDWFRQIEKQSYFKHYHEILDAVLNRPQIKITVAALKEDPEVVLGYSIIEPVSYGMILHWVFTKPVWRKLGIAKDLLPSGVTHITHLTKIGKSLKPQPWIFDPFLI